MSEIQSLNFSSELDRVRSSSASTYDYAYAKVQKSIFKPKILVFVPNIDIVLNAF